MQIAEFGLRILLFFQSAIGMGFSFVDPFTLTVIPCRKRLLRNSRGSRNSQREGMRLIKPEHRTALSMASCGYSTPHEGESGHAPVCKTIELLVRRSAPARPPAPAATVSGALSPAALRYRRGYLRTCSGSPQFTGNLSNRQPFMVPLVPDNVFAIHPQHPSLRSSSMFSDTKLSPGGLPAGGGSIS